MVVAAAVLMVVVKKRTTNCDTLIYVEHNHYNFELFFNITRFTRLKA